MANLPEAMQAAVNHHLAGRLDEAAAIYRQVLSIDPQHADARHLLGLVAHQQGDQPTAVTLISQAIHSDGSRPIYHNNLGEAYRALGRLDDAIACYERAVTLDPGIYQAWCNLALARRAQGDLAATVALCRQAIAIKPDYADALRLLAGTLWAGGDLPGARRAYEQLLEHDPQNMSVLVNLGVLLRDLGEFAEARQTFHQALAIAPGSAELHVHLGDVAAAGKDWSAATAAYETALSLDPRSAVAHLHLGSACQAQGLLDEAIGHYQSALAIQPDLVSAHYNLGTALEKLGRGREAAECFRAAWTLDPQFADAGLNLGGCYQELGELDQALECYERALAIKPDAAKAHFNRGLILLTKGRLAEGWPEYEWRTRIPGFPVRHFDLPRWNGEPRPNATLLVHSEQGLGDVLQFIRYHSQVRQRVGRVVTLVHPPLAAILRQSGFTDVFVDETALPRVDLQVPLLSLPGIFGATLDNLSAPSPYLSASPDLVAEWRERLAPLAGFRVGIAWQGSPKNLNDSARSFPLSALAPVAALPGVQIVSLQKRDGLDQLQALGGKFVIHSLGDDFDTSAGAFMDTAAVMMNLDLVIAADTATAHLAGGLGVNVWVPLATRADWRWFQDREDTPWYATMRLFRQRQPGDWEAVFERVTNEVRRLETGQFEGRLARARLEMFAGRTSAAMEHYRRVLTRDPDQVEAHVELGFFLLDHGAGTADETAGAEHLRKALAIDPAHTRAVVKLAIRAEQAGDLDEAKALYDRALAQSPDDPVLRLQRACVLLTAGDLARGWTEYAWRTKVFPSPVDAVQGPIWDGRSLGEETLLVVGEQGIGDVLQFVRFLPQVVERTPHVVLTVRDPLVPLLKQAGIHNVQGFTQPLPKFAAKVALLDLPRVLGTTLENLPAEVPYLAPREDLVESWRTRLATIAGFRVGICWKGSSSNPSDRNRSAPLAAFEPLARVAGVRLISLQKHEGLDELAAVRDRFEVVELGADLDTSAGLLMDTAAIIPQLDLVVSIDSAIAHLAGALAAPVWVALARRADWRWLANRDDSPWYPTMRLFRQERLGDWDELFARMAAELAPLAQRRLADRR